MFFPSPCCKIHFNNYSDFKNIIDKLDDKHFFRMREAQARYKEEMKLKMEEDKKKRAEERIKENKRKKEEQKIIKELIQVNNNEA